jgi:two-component system, OmpR family, sensor kinase
VPIRWRLTLFNALIIGAILLALGLSLFLLLREALLSGVEDTVRSRAVTVARALESGENPLNDDDVGQLTADGVFIVVRDEQGRVLDRTTNFSMKEEPRDPVWERALASGNPVGGTAELSSEEPDYVYAVPLDPSDGPARVVEAGKSYDPVEETLETFATVLAVGGMLAFLLSVGGAYLLARTALSPVEAVVSSAREMTEGDLSRRLPVAHPRDEIGRLTTTINALLARLEAAFARREEALSRQRRFAADASHELRTPLTSIAGYAQMLEEWGLRDPQTAREGVEAIRQESERMQRLVEGLLALTRGDEGAPLEIEYHDLAAVAEEAVQTARTAAGEKIALSYLPPEQPVNAPFDRNRIRQVASILLDNAVKYTPNGGKVTVTVRETNGWAALEVSDTGVGISEDQLPLIFERFYRAEKARASSGAGLGLSIARQIAEAHGGKFEVESTPGKGSTFTLLLPKRLPGLDDGATSGGTSQGDY